MRTKNRRIPYLAQSNLTIAFSFKLRLLSFLFILVLFSFCTKASAQLQKEEIAIDSNTVAVVFKDGFLHILRTVLDDYENNIVFYDGRVIKLPKGEMYATISDDILVTYDFQVDSINDQFTTIKKYLVGKNCGLTLDLATKVAGWRLFHRMWQDDAGSKFLISYMFAVEGGSCADSLKLMSIDNLRPLESKAFEPGINCMDLIFSQVSVDKIDMLFFDKVNFNWISIDRETSMIQNYAFDLNELPTPLGGFVVENKLYFIGQSKDEPKFQIFGVGFNSGPFFKQSLSNYPVALWANPKKEPMVLLGGKVFSVLENKMIENQPRWPEDVQPFVSWSKFLLSNQVKVIGYGY